MSFPIYLWLSKIIGKIKHEIIHWPTALWHELSTRLGSNAALPNPRHSQLHHLNCTKCWFCLVHPEASIPLRAGWWGCNILQLLYYGMSFIIHSSYILVSSFQFQWHMLLAFFQRLSIFGIFFKNYFITEYSSAINCVTLHSTTVLLFIPNIYIKLLESYS